MFVVIYNCRWTVNINMGAFFIPAFYRFNSFSRVIGSEHCYGSVINPLNCNASNTINKCFFYFIRALPFFFRSLSISILQFFLSLLFLMVPERLMPSFIRVVANAIPVYQLSIKSLCPLCWSTFSKNVNTI